MDKNKQQTINPGLYLISTPIGNMEDITLRALNVLKKSEVILCEDTRRSIKLLTHFKIKNKLQPYHKFNEKRTLDKVINFIIKRNDVDCVRSIRKSVYPPYWMKKLVGKKILTPLINNKNFIKTARRQDLPDAYMCDGYVDAIKIGSLIKNKCFPPKKCHAIMSDSKYFIDIDNKVDLALANMILKSNE